MSRKQLRSTAAPTSILNPAFAYTRSEDTDLHVTFARIRAGISVTSDCTLGVLPLVVMPEENLGDC